MKAVRKYRILFVTSEVQPLMKTGGLADVSAALPAALRSMGHDVRILTPAYADSLQSGQAISVCEQFDGDEAGDDARLLRTSLPESNVPVWMLDVPDFGSRKGSPYLDEEGKPWSDNAERFNRLSQIAALIAGDRVGLGWCADIVHCNEWHTGLIPVWLKQYGLSIATVFTIHNLAYQGLFPREQFDRLALPARLWSPRGLEFHNQLCMIKGGLQFADKLTTVSPNFAREILTPEYGNGLAGVLQERVNDLTGILNGLDTDCWNPKTDPWLKRNYDLASLELKRANKTAIQKQLGLTAGKHIPLVVMIGRLVHQKGVDYVIDAVPELMQSPLQLAILGTGDKSYRKALAGLQAKFPGKFALIDRFGEAIAHRLEAAADMLLMPSRFEPCGLTQLQSLRYGTVPIVSRTGGLLDTVINLESDSSNLKSATGLYIDELTPAGIVRAIQRALELLSRHPAWQVLMQNGMRQDFSWARSARQYERVYREASATVHSRG